MAEHHISMLKTFASGDVNKWFRRYIQNLFHTTHVNVQPRTQYDSQEAGKIIHHTQTCACTEQSVNMITDDVNGVSVSMVTVHVV